MVFDIRFDNCSLRIFNFRFYFSLPTGISYVTHPQAKPTRVTDFHNIERIMTAVLPASATPSSTQKDSQQPGNDSNGHHKSSSGSSSSSNGQSYSKNATNSPLSHKKSSDKRAANTCNCNEMKTLLKIKVTGNSDDLTITCNGVKAAESIADLVDGYCRIVNNTEMSLWDRSRTPTGSATNSLEKQKQQQKCDGTSSGAISQQPPNLPAQNAPIGEHVNAKNDALSVQPSSIAVTSIEMNMPILSEDYVDIGLGEEEGDYSTPAARNYELDRLQITLNDIIGVGQFGDVHIGTCRINKSSKSKNASSGVDDSSQKDGASSNGGDADAKSVIQVAVKTCKADADMQTSEKFLEEACKCYTFRTSHLYGMVGLILIFK